MKLIKKILFFLLLFIFIIGCTKNDGDDPTDSSIKHLTIFFVNDQHGRLDNFSKVKYIVDKEKKSTNVIVACSGDIFSGNPVVDYYKEKGYPMIDVMNKVGFDISTVGNHEFDYGEDILKDRMEQADFPWVCANVNMLETDIPQPFEYTTISVDDIKVTFLGLIETNGKQDANIPSTHPGKIKNIGFERPENVVQNYSDLKNKENSDLYIALTHLGHAASGGRLGDFQLAQQFPYFDLIIGGHTNAKLDTKVNGIYIYQAGNNLDFLGKIVISIKDKKIKSSDFELIDLNKYTNFDDDLKAVIDSYNDRMSIFLDEIIGFSHHFHDRSQVGCFYTDALREKLNVDITFQNIGGIRNFLDQGDITKREIYTIDPFNNGTLIYNMSVSEIKNFLSKANSDFYYSGINISGNSNTILLSDLNDNILDDSTFLSVGINDYIPAVFDNYFPTNGNIQSFTTAEGIIMYLKDINNQVNYTECNRVFRN